MILEVLDACLATVCLNAIAASVAFSKQLDQLDLRKFYDILATTCRDATKTKNLQETSVSPAILSIVVSSLQLPGMTSQADQKQDCSMVLG